MPIVSPTGTLDLTNVSLNVGAVTANSLSLQGGSLTVEGGNLTTNSMLSNGVTIVDYSHTPQLRRFPNVALTSANDFDISGTSDGYLSSASSTYSADFSSYFCFDKVTNKETVAGYGWQPPGSATNYNSYTGAWTGGTGGNTEMTLTNGETIYGDWVQLRLPVGQSVRVSHFHYYPIFFDGGSYDSLGNQRSPKDGYLLGSSDGSSWTKLLGWSNRTNFVETKPNKFEVNASSAYQYLRVVWAATVGGTYGNYASSGNIEFFGYDDDQRGDHKDIHLVSKASFAPLDLCVVAYDGRLSTRDGANVSDISGNDQTGLLNGGVTYDTVTKSWEFDDTALKYINRSLTITGGDWPHSVSTWFNASNLQASHSAAQYVYFLGNFSQYESSGMYFVNQTLKVASWTADYRVDYTFAENEWYHVAFTHTGEGWWPPNIRCFVNGKRVAFLENDSVGTGGTQINLPTSTTLSIGSSGVDSGFIGKIGSFRLYEGPMSDEHLVQMYEADKEHYGLSTSKISIVNARVGLGVDAPKKDFECLGDSAVEEFPPEAMRSHAYYVPNHGTFVATASSWRTDQEGNEPYRAFNKSTGLEAWIQELNDSTNHHYDSSIDYRYSGTAKLTDTSPPGEYLMLSCPYRIKLKKIAIEARSNVNTATDNLPEDAWIYAQDDRGTWTPLTSWKGQSYTSNLHTTFIDVNATDYYRSFALVTTKTRSSSYVVIGEWRLFGNREPTSIDKGALVAPSADIANIGSQKSDLPRPDDLVLMVDTTINPLLGNVVSSQGKPVDFAQTYNGASYVEHERALSFSAASNSYVKYGYCQLGTGNWPHSFSVWVKITNTTDSVSTLFYIGDDGATTGTASYIDWYSNGDLYFTFYNTYALVSIPREIHKWYHLVFTHDGSSVASGMRMYINGQEVKFTTRGGTVSLNLSSTSKVCYLGGNAGSKSFTGYLSNFAVWDGALTRGEAARLYAMGRTGDSMAINKSLTVGGGGGTPRATLDVRGDIRCDGYIREGLKPAFMAYSNYSGTDNMGEGTVLNAGNVRLTGGTSGDPIPYDRVEFDTTNSFNTTTHLFTAPVSGIYTFNAMVYTPTDTAMLVRRNGSAEHGGSRHSSLNTYNFSLFSWQNDDGPNLSWHMYLDKGDTVAPGFWNQVDAYMPHSFFSGHLVQAVEMQSNGYRFLPKP